jgi:hypothetical protein
MVRSRARQWATRVGRRARRVRSAVATPLRQFGRRLGQGAPVRLRLPGTPRGPDPLCPNGSVALADDLRGHGSPLVLIQGVGVGRWGWEPVADRLARRFQVIIIDLLVQACRAVIQPLPGRDVVARWNAGPGPVGGPGEWQTRAREGPGWRMRRRDRWLRLAGRSHSPLGTGRTRWPRTCRCGVRSARSAVPLATATAAGSPQSGRRPGSAVRPPHGCRLGRGRG